MSSEDFLIDMQQKSEVAEKVVKACEEWGFFRVTNHGVPLNMIREVTVVGRSLLDLPTEIKQKNSYPQPAKGYIAMGDIYDSLGIYDPASAMAMDQFCSQLDVSPNHRKIIWDYFLAVHGLAQELGSKLMDGLGLGGEGVDIFKDWICQLRFNKYNFSPQTLELDGAVTHTDNSFLTILREDEVVNGLEVVNKYTGEFISIDPLPGSLLVFLGDIAKAWSNGRFHNVKHKVKCYQPKVRISIAIFVLAPREEKVEAPLQLVDSDHSHRYVAFDFEEYRMLRISTRSSLGEALEYFSSP